MISQKIKEIHFYKRNEKNTTDIISDSCVAIFLTICDLSNHYINENS